MCALGGIAARWRRSLSTSDSSSSVLNSEQHEQQHEHQQHEHQCCPSPLAMEQTLARHAGVDQQLIRTSLVRRAAAERRQGRLVFSAYVQVVKDIQHLNTLVG
jgi:hypothetical protein